MRLAQLPAQWKRLDRPLRRSRLLDHHRLQAPLLRPRHVGRPASWSGATRWARPKEYGPNVYYTISGAVDREVLARDLDTAVLLGFHAVTVQPGRGNKEAYLSPEYFRMLWSEMQLHFSSFLGEVVKLEKWRRVRRHSLSSDVPQTRSTSK